MFGARDLAGIEQIQIIIGYINIQIKTHRINASDWPGYSMSTQTTVKYLKPQSIMVNRVIKNTQYHSIIIYHFYRTLHNIARFIT